MGWFSFPRFSLNELGYISGMALGAAYLFYKGIQYQRAEQVRILTENEKEIYETLNQMEYKCSTSAETACVSY